MTEKQKATDFLDKCRKVSAIEQVVGIFVEMNGSGDIIIRKGYIENGEYDVEDMEEFSPVEFFEETPHETVLSFDRMVSDRINGKEYYIEENLYEMLKDINENGFVVLEDEDFDEDNY